MPLGRRHVVLIAALMLASAGVAMAVTVADEPPARPAARVLPRSTTTATTEPPTTTSTTAAPRIWSDVADCTKAEADRPAILSYSMNQPDGPLVYAQAVRMAKAAGIPTDNLERQGAAMWWGYAEASGTVGSLLGPARKLVAKRNDGLYMSAQLYCAGHRHNTDRIWLLLRDGTEPGTVIARAGTTDVVADVTDRSGGRITAYIRTFAPLAVEHAMAYLAVDGVLTALPSSDCAVGVAAGSLSVPKDLLPTSSTSTTSATTTATIPVQYDYSYTPSYCGTEVTAA